MSTKGKQQRAKGGQGSFLRSGQTVFQVDSDETMVFGSERVAFVPPIWNNKIELKS